MSLYQIYYFSSIAWLNSKMPAEAFSMASAGVLSWQAADNIIMKGMRSCAWAFRKQNIKFGSIQYDDLVIIKVIIKPQCISDDSFLFLSMDTNNWSFLFYNYMIRYTLSKKEIRKRPFLVFCIWPCKSQGLSPEFNNHSFFHAFTFYPATPGCWLCRNQVQSKGREPHYANPLADKVDDPGKFFC